MDVPACMSARARVCLCVATWRWVGRVETRLFTKFGREPSGEVFPVNGRLGGEVMS
jgi:hypothetical protein